MIVKSFISIECLYFIIQLLCNYRNRRKKHITQVHLVMAYIVCFYPSCILDQFYFSKEDLFYMVIKKSAKKLM